VAVLELVCLRLECLRLKGSVLFAIGFLGVLAVLSIGTFTLGTRLAIHANVLSFVLAQTSFAKAL
jgi:hypothetical protein